MKTALLSFGLLALGASFAAAPNQRSAHTACLLGLTPAVATTASATDDPPPPVDDCPFCGGNPTLHRARFFAVQSELARICVRLVP